MPAAFRSLKNQLLASGIVALKNIQNKGLKMTKHIFLTLKDSHTKINK